MYQRCLTMLVNSFKRTFLLKAQSEGKIFVKVYCQNHYFQLKKRWVLFYVIFSLRVLMFFMKRVIPHYAKVSFYQSSFTTKFTCLLIEYFDCEYITPSMRTRRDS